MTGNQIFTEPGREAEITKEIAARLDLRFVSEAEPEGNVCLAHSSEIRYDYRSTFTRADLQDYVYAVFHLPRYRGKYDAFSETDFPRVPYPKDTPTFWKLVHLGGQIRRIHLPESPVVKKFITQYPIDGDNVVTKIRFEENYEIMEGDPVTHPDPVYSMGRVYINDTQFFQNVPTTAWHFYIGGDQPAQKWLKDRKGRVLGFDDILHYQKIIVALSETDQLMRAIDGIEPENQPQ